MTLTPSPRVPPPPSPCQGLHEEIVEEINKLGGNDLLMKIVELLAQYKV